MVAKHGESSSVYTQVVEKALLLTDSALYHLDNLHELADGMVLPPTPPPTSTTTTI
jgi:hypothetical protein